MNFVAIDFETANEQRSSPSAVGPAVVKNGAISERLARLIRPGEFRFSERNMAIHGIRPENVENEPEFPDVWLAIRPYIENGTVLAHSATFNVGVPDKYIEIVWHPAAGVSVPMHGTGRQGGLADDW